MDGNSLERSVLFGREIVERKLQIVGPLPSDFNKRELYAMLPDAAEAVNPWLGPVSTRD